MEFLKNILLRMKDIFLFSVLVALTVFFLFFFLVLLIEVDLVSDKQLVNIFWQIAGDVGIPSASFYELEEIGEGYAVVEATPTPFIPILPAPTPSRVSHSGKGSLNQIFETKPYSIGGFSYRREAETEALFYMMNLEEEIEVVRIVFSPSIRKNCSLGSASACIHEDFRALYIFVHTGFKDGVPESAEPLRVYYESYQVVEKEESKEDKDREDSDREFHYYTGYSLEMIQKRMETTRAITMTGPTQSIDLAVIGVARVSPVEMHLVDNSEEIYNYLAGRLPEMKKQKVLIFSFCGWRIKEEVGNLPDATWSRYYIVMVPTQSFERVD